MYNNISLPNERSRLYLAIAQVDHQTFSIDKPLRAHGRIGDRALFNGKHYSDKAPGTGFLGAVVYQTVRLFTSADDWNIAGNVPIVGGRKESDRLVDHSAEEAGAWRLVRIVFAVKECSVPDSTMRP